MILKISKGFLNGLWLKHNFTELLSHLKFPFEDISEFLNTIGIL